MTFMHRRFRSYKGRPAWWWRAYANRHERRSHGTAPVNTVAPVVSGTETEGETLSVTDGTWTGTAPITYSYQWYWAITDANGPITVGSNYWGVPISGATDATYDLQSTDVGKQIFCNVTATNSVGSATQSSNVTGEIASVATTTLNPSDKTSNATLSNGNLTLTVGAAAYNGARSVASASSGKKYWEVSADGIVSGAGSIVQGFATSGASLASYLGGSADSVGWAGDGKVYLNGPSVATIQTWAQGDVLCFALDIGAQKIWFRKNGGNWNNDVIGNQNPATGAGGISIAAMNAAPYYAAVQGTGNGDALTANFGGSAYAQTAPSGFGNF